jgi:hypothetical protein
MDANKENIPSVASATRLQLTYQQEEEVAYLESFPTINTNMF